MTLFCKKTTILLIILIMGWAEGVCKEKEMESIIESSILNLYERMMSDSISYKTMKKILSKFMTKEMKEKYERQTMVGDVDLLLQAQDWSEYGRKTLACRNLSGLWYEASYTYAPNQAPTRIVLLVDTCRQKTLIAYVAPYLSEEIDCIDHAFDFETAQCIDNQDVHTFVRTFYNAYTDLYSSMPVNLEKKAKELRNKYITKKLSREFKEAENEYRKDGVKNYDLLIDCTDFDVYWRSSLTISSLGKNMFEISYHINSQCEKRLYVYVKNVNGHYKIDKIVSLNYKD